MYESGIVQKNGLRAIFERKEVVVLATYFTILVRKNDLLLQRCRHVHTRAH